MTKPFPEPSIESWQDSIENLLRTQKVSFIRRVMVVRETNSTQEAAGKAVNGPNPQSTLVVADRQTAGRGRLGRPWIQGSTEPSRSSPHIVPRGLGIAATFALVNFEMSPERISLAAGLAACSACAASIPTPAALGLRWPNDVVERAGVQRKLSGVLVEKVGKAMLVGVGINVLHEVEDFPDTLAERAVSLHQLGSTDTRLAVLLRLIAELDRTLRTPAEKLAAEWSALDILVGSKRTLIHAGHRHEGIILSIQPTSHIELKTDEGIMQLPSQTTGLVHEQ